MKLTDIFKENLTGEITPRNIEKRITNVLLTIIIVLSFILGGVASISSYTSSMNSLELAMSETAKVAAKQISNQLHSYRNIAYEIGCIPELSDSDISPEKKQAIINLRASVYGFRRGNILDKNAISLFDGEDYSDHDYFQASINGRTFASDPIVNRLTGELTTIISAPLWKNGIPGSTPIGIIYLVPDESFLNLEMKKIKIGTSGSSYIINSRGLTIAHENEAIVGIENTINMARTDSSLKPLAKIEQKMIDGENGFDKYEYHGVKKLSAYAPIEGTDGWSIATTVTQSEFLVGLKNALMYVLLTVTAFIILGVILASRFASIISKPLIDCTEKLKLISEQALNSPDATEEDIAHENEDLVGTYNTIEMSKPFIECAEQVSNGSEQISAGAQALAQGSTEQSSSVEELIATISAVSQRVQRSAENASDASIKVDLVGNDVENCNLEMKKMNEAMADINNSSSEIGKIIKTIEDIAFQTNILALNAAVEAARAGSAGKGFAVVADEVRNLANKSAEAAKNTTVLIEDSIKAIENGGRISNNTSNIMNSVYENTKTVVEVINMISSDSAEQARSIAEVQQGIDQISSVVHSNSATAEESAASSEELSAQAEALKSMIGNFRLAD